LIIEDDLIYAKKDDFSDRELQPGNEDIDKAIGWHKLCTSLLVPGKHTHIHNIGTRWAPHDLVDYIWEHEPDYDRFIIGAVDLEELDGGKHWMECRPTWPEAYDMDQLKKIEHAQGPYMFATQYLLKPSSPQEHLFDGKWLEYYSSSEFVPTSIRKFTTVDLAEWGDSKRKAHDCNAVILTCGWDEKNHCWILGYDSGRYDPTEVIDIMARHWKVYSPEMIAVEAVYYQKALTHYAKKAMEEGKVPWMRVREIKPEGNMAKELRIRAIEPIASNHAIHCRLDHKEFIREFTEYIPNNNSCKKDILDAFAYQIQIARPGQVEEVKKGHEMPQNFPIYADEVLAAMMTKGTKDTFGNMEYLGDPFSDEDSGIEDGFDDYLD
jgi:hypothetical protein